VVTKQGGERVSKGERRVNGEGGNGDYKRSVKTKAIARGDLWPRKCFPEKTKKKMLKKGDWELKRFSRALGRGGRGNKKRENRMGKEGDRDLTASLMRLNMKCVKKKKERHSKQQKTGVPAVENNVKKKKKWGSSRMGLIGCERRNCVQIGCKDKHAGKLIG